MQGLRVRGDQWNVGFVSLDTKGAPGDLDLTSVRWLPRLRPETYVADPFLVRRAGRTVVLLEEFDQRTKQGVITAIELDATELTVTAEHRGVIDPGTHVSYPYLVDVDDQLFCVPEAARSGAVDAWRCDEFPYGWTRCRTLLADVALVDPTVFHHGEYWWLFATMRGERSDSHLHAWYAPHFYGPYLPHRLNPVKVDARSSRGGGTPFRHGDSWYRPAQDCSRRYGGALTINRIDRLTPTDFAETTVLRVAPAADHSAGLHTLNMLDGLAVIDGNRRIVDISRINRELRRRLARREERS